MTRKIKNVLLMILKIVKTRKMCFLTMKSSTKELTHTEELRRPINTITKLAFSALKLYQVLSNLFHFLFTCCLSYTLNSGRSYCIYFDLVLL
jgi:hypothetical protein